MDPLTMSIISSAIWDGIKLGGKITGKYLKGKLKNWVLDEKDYETIAKTVNEAPEQFKKTEKFLEAYLDDDKAINDILVRARPTNQNTISGGIFKNSPVVMGNVEKQEIHYHGGETNPPKKT